LDFRIEFVL